MHRHTCRLYPDAVSTPNRNSITFGGRGTEEPVGALVTPAYMPTFKKLVNRLTEQVNAHADERNRCASAAKEAGLGCGDDSGGCGLFRVLLGTFLYQAAGNTMF